jgi:hypothetical protein
LTEHSTRAGRPERTSDGDLTGGDDGGYAVSTYRYLRLAIVAAVATLGISLGLERSAATCWNGSISAYYYSPVHSIFVAGLGVIGVALFAIRGARWWEEVLLNGAGFLSPVVAFVPTGWSIDDCPSNLTGTSKPAVDQLLAGNHFFSKFSGNNLVAFIAGGLVAIAVTSAIAMSLGKAERRLPPKELTIPAIGSAAVVIVGYIWHQIWPASFDTHAHSYSAILMFLLVGLVMLSTGLRDPSRWYTRVYIGLAVSMAVGFAIVVVVGLLVTWHHQVLVLEVVEITLFVTFWLLQTIQLWDMGVASE